MQTTKWASFKHRWVRAEVYPLAAAIGGALGICSYFVYNKAFNDPSVTWSKGPRKSGVEAQYSHVEDDVKPLWSSAAANRSISVFRSANEIMDAKRTPNPTFPLSAFVMADPDSDEEEDDDDVEEVEAAPVVRIINEDGAPVSDAVESAKESAADAADTVADMATVAKASAADTVEAGKARAAAVADTVADKAAAVKDWAADTVEAGKTHAVDAAHTVADKAAVGNARAAGAVDSAKASAANAADTVADKAHHAYDATREATADVEEKVMSGVHAVSDASAAAYQSVKEVVEDATTPTRADDPVLKRAAVVTGNDVPVVEATDSSATSLAAAATAGALQSAEAEQIARPPVTVSVK